MFKFKSPVSNPLLMQNEACCTYVCILLLLLFWNGLEDIKTYFFNSLKNLGISYIEEIA